MNPKFSPIHPMTRRFAIFGLIGLVASLICLVIGNPGLAAGLFVASVADLALTGILVAIGEVVVRSRRATVKPH